LSELMAQVDTFAALFHTAQPFPHVVIDDFLPTDVADAVLDAFPVPESPIWTRLPTEDQRHKLATTDEGQIPPLVRAVLLELNSGRFLRFLERLTGTPDLIADTKMVGGGLHQILRGGKLSVHVDYSHHPQNGLFRRLNLLIYLTRDWVPTYKGELELWDQNVSACVAKIAPVFNRCAIFATSHLSYHGHAEPLNFPEGMTRKS